MSVQPEIRTAKKEKENKRTNKNLEQIFFAFLCHNKVRIGICEKRRISLAVLPILPFGSDVIMLLTFIKRRTFHRYAYSKTNVFVMQRKSHYNTFNTFLIGYSSNLSRMPIDTYQQGHTSKYNMQQCIHSSQCWLRVPISSLLHGIEIAQAGLN